MLQNNGPSGIKPVAAVEAAVPVPAIQRLQRDAAIGTEAENAATDARASLRGRQAAQAYAQDDTAAAPQPIRRVDELMTSEVFVLNSDTRLGAALQALEASGHAQAPVVGPDRRLLGLFVPPLFGFAPGIDAETPLVQLLAAPVEPASPATDIRAVARLLTATGLPGLAVVNATGQLCGFITRGDIVRAVGQEPPLDLWA